MTHTQPQVTTAPNLDFPSADPTIPISDEQEDLADMSFDNNINSLLPDSNDESNFTQDVSSVSNAKQRQLLKKKQKRKERAEIRKSQQPLVKLNIPNSMPKVVAFQPGPSAPPVTNKSTPVLTSTALPPKSSK